MFKRPSQKLVDIFREINEAPEPPVERHTLPYDKRQILSAYGRACSVRSLGREVSVRDIADYAQDPLPYGSVARSKVAGLLQELMDIGFEFTISDYQPPKSATRKSRGEDSRPADHKPEPTVQADPAARAAPDVPETSKPERKRRSKTEGLVPQLRASADNPNVLELVGVVEPKTVLVSKATLDSRANTRGRGTNATGTGTAAQGSGVRGRKNDV